MKNNNRKTLSLINMNTIKSIETAHTITERQCIFSNTT